MTKNDSKRIISRLAPTPNGYLHLGNALNFLITWLSVRKQNGYLHLRIDDIDRVRVRNKYIEDIFFCLDWLQIDVDEGPSNVDDFNNNHSQQLHLEDYALALKKLSNTYSCVCTRKQLKNKTSQLYPQNCLNRGFSFSAFDHQIRIHCPKNSIVNFCGQTIDLSNTVGDFVIWRKDNIPAYQLASVVDDHRIGTSLVIRGRDLFNSSVSQFFLAHELGYQSFINAEFVHHDLLLDHQDKKMSKSNHSQSLSKMIRSGTTRKEVFNQLLPSLLMNIGSPSLNSTDKVTCVKDLLQFVIDNE